MKKNFVTLFLLLVVGLVSAQQKELTLSLQEAQNYALAHNRSLENASLDIKIAEAQKWQSLSSMLPQAKLTYDYQNMLGYEMELHMAEGAEPIKIALNPNGTFKAQVSMTVSAQMIMGVFLSSVAKEMKDVSYKQSVLELNMNVSQIYLSILTMEQTDSLLSSNLQNIKSIYTSTQNAVEVGAVERTEAQKLSVQVAQMEKSINDARRNTELLYNSLRLYLGENDTVEIRLTEGLDDLLNAETALELLKTPFDIDRNFQYQLAQKGAEMAEKNVKMAYIAYVPTMTAFYTYQNINYFGNSAGFNMSPDDLVGISLSMPIFTSFKNVAAIKEKHYSYRQAKNSEADAYDALKVQDKQLRYNLSSAYENLEIQKKNITVTQQVLDQISDKYTHGMASSIELTSASSDLVSSESNYIAAILDLVKADLALRQLLNL